MGIRILLYHTRMFADCSNIAQASKQVHVAVYVQCMQKYAKVYHYVNFKANI